MLKWTSLIRFFSLSRILVSIVFLLIVLKNATLKTLVRKVSLFSTFGIITEANMNGQCVPQIPNT